MFELYGSYFGWNEQKDENKLLELTQLLLENHADPNYTNHFHCGEDTTFGSMIEQLEWFKEKTNQLKIIQMFLDHEVEEVNNVGEEAESKTTWSYY